MTTRNYTHSRTAETLEMQEKLQGIGIWDTSPSRTAQQPANETPTEPPVTICSLNAFPEMMNLVITGTVIQMTLTTPMMKSRQLRSRSWETPTISERGIQNNLADAIAA